DPLVDRARVALQDEGVRTAHRLPVAHVDLAVGKVVRGRRDELDLELSCDVLGERGVRASRDQHETFLAVVGEEPGHASLSFVLASFAPGPAGAGRSWLRARSRSARAWGESPCSGSASAAAAASAAGVPARERSTQPSIVRWEPAETASAPGGTSLRISAPAPVWAPSPTVTGATTGLCRPADGRVGEGG